MKTAILVDGAFFLSRHYRLMGKEATPKEVARSLHAICFQHIRKLKREKHCLYRIFYYDCPPLTKKVHDPVSKKAIDLSKSSLATWRISFFRELKKLRKVALRLGHLDERNSKWVLHENSLKALLNKTVTFAELTSDDFKYDVRQKGVDMRIGLDIASLAYKKQVDQIVLISGDSDFVSAAKLARREGIDFILDPMWHPIHDDLHEHIDGLQGVIKKNPAPSPPGTSLVVVEPAAPSPSVGDAID